MVQYIRISNRLIANSCCNAKKSVGITIRHGIERQEYTSNHIREIGRQVKKLFMKS